MAIFCLGIVVTIRYGNSRGGWKMSKKLCIINRIFCLHVLRSIISTDFLMELRARRRQRHRKRAGLSAMSLGRKLTGTLHVLSCLEWRNKFHLRSRGEVVDEEGNTRILCRKPHSFTRFATVFKKKNLYTESERSTNNISRSNRERENACWTICWPSSLFPFPWPC